MRKTLKRGLSAVLAFVMTVSVALPNVPVQASSGTAKAQTTNKIDVWDFGAVQETNETLYTNHIQAEDWNNCESVGTNGVFAAVNGSLDANFGDVTISYTANDRLYINDLACTKNYGTWGSTILTFPDGYTSDGVYYCNGSGGSGRRYVKIDNVKAGDKITAYVLAHSNADNMHFKYLGSDAVQDDTTMLVSKEPTKLEFVAEHDGSYQIYADTGMKHAFYRVTRTPAIEVTGTIDLSNTNAVDFTLNFVNTTTGQSTAATVEGTNFTVSLAAGYEYTAVMSGVTGVGISAATKVVVTTEDEILTGKTVDLVAENKTTYAFTGSVVGFDSSYDVSNLAIELVPMGESTADKVALELVSGLDYDVRLEPDVDYEVVMTGVNDYEVTAGGVVNVTNDLTQNIEVTMKPVYTAEGQFINLPADKTVTAITFTNEEDGYLYTGTVVGTGYTVDLRDGAYSVSATVDGYKTSSHVVVEGGVVTKDLLFVSTDNTVVPMDRVSDIYVGYPGKDNNYATIKEAIAACKAMNPTSEDERITVHIAPGTYREQLIIETPYISFVNDEPDQEVLLTWYYGIGYRYYSADATGYYNEENAFDQYKKAIAAKWGVATFVKNTATAFRAQNITFESSFNRYVTDEEIADGVEVSYTESIRVERTKDTDVKTKAATERAAALCVEADETEFVNCSFLSSQDTLYTANDIKAYFKDCFIEGNTDYIFGGGNVVFDQCELSWYGYTDNSQAGYITASRQSSSEAGYLFKNCTVTGNTENGVVVTPGYLGRPWGADANVCFYNTTLEDANYITPEGWTVMSGNQPENATYAEYNTKLADGTTVDLSNRVTNKFTSVNDYKATNYFGSWVPVNYEEDNNGGDVDPAPVEKSTIWVVGDSTVSAFDDAYFYPRYGWGTSLNRFFDSSKFEIKNIALSGRSSKSFITEPEYQELLAGMKQGDYLFIGFGHNDEKTEVERYTNPNGNSTVEGSLANSLYENYIKPAEAVGCTPILMTPIVRRSDTGTFTNSQLHITTTATVGDVVFEGGDYAQAIRDLGNEVNVKVVDLTALTKELYEQLGASETLYLHAWLSSKEGSVDNTHTNIWGSIYNGYFIAKSIKEQGIAGLSEYVVDSMIQAAPAKSDYLVSNPSYVEPSYDNNLKDSELFADFGFWKGSAFGDIGGNPTVDNFTLGATASGDMNIAVKNNKGKISGATDGLAMYYYKVPVGSSFTLTATATVNDIVLNDQVSFGLMARDAMYIDVNSKDPLGDYVAAGPLKMLNGPLWNCFARKSTTLTQGGVAQNTTISAGQSYDLKIESNSDGYACTFGNETTITGGFDFQLTSIDSDYVYVGMFAARNADITFTNIKLVVDGKEVTETPAPEVTETPAPEVTETPAPEVTETPAPEVTETPAPEVTETPAPEVTVTPAPEVTVTPAPEVTVTPAPEVTVTPAPTQTPVKAPGKTTLKVSSQTKTSIKLSWKKVSGATGYQVQTYQNKKWVTIKKTSATSLTVKKLKTATTYKYRVRAYKTVNGKQVNGGFSSVVTTTTKTKAPVLSVKAGTKKATLSWKKVSGATGYEVYMSTKKASGYKKVATMKKASSVKYTAKKLKSKKTYYFKVRAYKTVSGKKVYSDFSTVKKVKVK